MHGFAALWAELPIYRHLAAALDACGAVESNERFRSQDALAAMPRDAGLASVRYGNVSLGIGCIHLRRGGGSRCAGVR